jgi:hypothetical protein
MLKILVLWEETLCYWVCTHTSRRIEGSQCLSLQRKA